MLDRTGVVASRLRDRGPLPPFSLLCVSASDAHRLGYRQVDDDGHVSVLVEAMDATGRWDATRVLREWERQGLELCLGERLLDVGCGPGEALVSLAAELGATGEVVGLDSSAEMLEVARRRSQGAPCAVRLVLGDAMALDEISRSFDAVRCERTLQWLSDPQVAVSEMCRVLRPGGRIALIDTDWSTFTIDIGSPALSEKIRNAMRVERNRPSHVGKRLAELLEAGGLDVVAQTTRTQIWNVWDPDDVPAPDGCFSMESLAEDLIDAKQLDPNGAADFVASVHDAARQDRFTMSLRMHAVIAASPDPGVDTVGSPD